MRNEPIHGQVSPAPYRDHPSSDQGSTPTHSGQQRAATCAHCGDLVPSGLIDAAAEYQFCCQGCRTVHAVVHGCGLDRYYVLQSQGDRKPAAANMSQRRYGEFDDPTFHRLYVRCIGGEPSGHSQVELFLPSVHCAACVWLVEKLPRVVPGVLEARLDLRRALVRITWNSQQATLSVIARALDSLGYAPSPARGASIRSAQRQEDRRQLIRLGVAGACAGNVMLLALALYAGMFDEIEPAYLHLFRWVSMGLSILSLSWPGRVFFMGAWSALRTRTLHLDLPIALGLGAGAVWGVVSTVRGTGEIYFDSLSVLVFALLLGRFFQSRQQRWTSDAIELLFSVTPTSARVATDIWDDEVRDVPIEAVERGMIVEVRAGDSIPVDGVVMRGTSSIDQSMLTGEPRPVDVREGMGVAAGAVNLSSTIRVRVEATGEDTRVGRLMRLVADCAERRAPIVRTTDRLAGWFVASMLVLSAVTAALWMWIEPARAVDNAVALLIVTCPCALGLATPLALTAAIGRAARRGVLVKGGDALQAMGSNTSGGVIFLDKTGTITLGRMSLVRWVGDKAVQPLVAAVEKHSSHPIALALTRDCSIGLSGPLIATEIHQTTGHGIEANVDGHHVVVGSRRFVAARSDGADFDPIQIERELTSDGCTPVLVAVDGRMVAAAGLGDPIRDDAAEAIKALRGSGWQVKILSGDHPEIVQSVGRQLGLCESACRGSMSPEEKLAAVREAVAIHASMARNRRHCSPVVMVGDGVNDAAALAAANVGIAVQGGAEASLAAADVYLNAPGLNPVMEVLLASRRVMKVIRWNLAASLFYNGLAATLAMTGLINPLIAAVLMPVSSLTVVTLSFRSKTFRTTAPGVKGGD